MTEAKKAARADWLVTSDRRSVGVRRIHRATRELLLERGAADVTADAIARRAGCSRATLYRLVGSRAALVEEVLGASARGVVDQIERAVVGLDGEERAVVAITAAIAAIRADRLMASWVRTRALVSLGDVVGSSDRLAGLSAVLTGTLAVEGADAWIVRCVVGYVLVPGQSAEAERAEIARFVIPRLSTGRTTASP